MSTNNETTPTKRKIIIETKMLVCISLRQFDVEKSRKLLKQSALLLITIKKGKHFYYHSLML